MAVTATKQQWETLLKEADILNEFLSLKMTLPLGNPALKNVHTNQFLWYDLPAEFKLEYMKVISDQLHFSDVKDAYYKEGRWYVEGVTIHNDGSKFSMDLELSPFASSFAKYRDNYNNYVKNWDDWKKSLESQSKEGGDGSTTETKSTENSTLKGGFGTTIDNKVKEICGNTTDSLEKAKKIDRWLNQNVSYRRYCCGKYGTDATKAYNNRGALNCGDTAMLTTAMMRSAGLTADVVWAPGHFWTRIKINGKEYFSDQTDKSRAWNTVWKGMRYSSVKGTWCGCEAYSC